MSNSHAKHMAHAKFIGNLYSKDTSSKVGALILGENNEPLSWGYNGFPRGANDNPEDHPERHDRTKEKYQWAEHAERNAIYSAARSGHKLYGSRIYVSSLPTCADCARAIVQAGIKEVYVEAKVLEVDRWKESWGLAQKIYAETGVKVIPLQDT
jgi:dCMP deaminase